MIYIIDSVKVKDEKAKEYLQGFAADYLPSAQKRGRSLIASWETPDNAGVERELVFIWGVESWEKWSESRLLMLFDPGTREWLQKAAGMIVDGSRRFYTPTELSPMK